MANINIDNNVSSNSNIVELTTEQIGHAISEYLERRQLCALKIEFKIVTEMTDSTYPVATGKLTGATITTVG